MLHVSLHCVPVLQKEGDAAKATATSEEFHYPEIMDLWELFNAGRIKTNNVEIQVKLISRHATMMVFWVQARFLFFF